MRSITGIVGLVVLFACTTAAQQQPTKQRLGPDVPREDRFGNYMLRNASVSVRKLNASGGSSSFDMDLPEGGMQVMLGGWSHKLSNKGTAAAKLVMVEVARNIGPQNEACGLSAPDCRDVRFGKTDRGEYWQTTLFETASTRLIRAQLGPKSVLELHDDGRPLTHICGHTEQGRFSLAPGEVQWIDGGFGALLNDDTIDARMLIVEIKN